MKPRTLLGIGGAAIALALVLLGVESARRTLPEGLVRVRGPLVAETSSVVATVEGRVISLTVREGDEVEAGASLATLSSDRVAAEVEQAASALDAARVALAQAELAADASARASARDAARDAQQRLDEARARFEGTDLRAPGRGRVVGLRLHVGDVVSRDARVAEIVDASSLHLEAEVSAAVREKLAPGQAARVRVVPGPKRAIQARVDSVEEIGSTRDAADAASHARVRLTLVESPGDAIAPGTQAEALVRWRDDVAFPDDAR